MVKELLLEEADPCAPLGHGHLPHRGNAPFESSIPPSQEDSFDQVWLLEAEDQPQFQSNLLPATQLVNINSGKGLGEAIDTSAVCPPSQSVNVNRFSEQHSRPYTVTVDDSSVGKESNSILLPPPSLGGSNYSVVSEGSEYSSPPPSFLDILKNKDSDGNSIESAEARLTYANITRMGVPVAQLSTATSEEDSAKGLTDLFTHSEVLTALSEAAKASLVVGKGHTNISQSNNPLMSSTVVLPNSGLDDISSTLAQKSCCSPPIPLSLPSSYAGVVKSGTSQGGSTSPQPSSSHAGSGTPISESLKLEAQMMVKMDASTVWFRRSAQHRFDSYISAVGQVIGDDAIHAINTDDPGRVEVLVTSPEAAASLVKIGIIIDGEWLKAYMITERPLKITLAKVPPFIPHQTIVDALAPFGSCTTADVEPVRAFTRRNTQRHIVTFRRSVWLRIPKNARRLPESLVVYFAGRPFTLTILDSENKCFACGKTGHIRAKCPSLSPNFEPLGAARKPSHSAITPMDSRKASGTTTSQKTTDYELWLASAGKVEKTSPPSDSWILVPSKKKVPKVIPGRPLPPVSPPKVGKGQAINGPQWSKNPVQTLCKEEDPAPLPPLSPCIDRVLPILRSPRRSHRLRANMNVVFSDTPTEDTSLHSVTVELGKISETPPLTSKLTLVEKLPAHLPSAEGVDAFNPPSVVHSISEQKLLGTEIESIEPHEEKEPVGIPSDPLPPKVSKRRVNILANRYQKAVRKFLCSGNYGEEPLGDMGVKEALQIFHDNQVFFHASASLLGLGDFLDQMANRGLMDSSEDPSRRVLKRPATSSVGSTEDPSNVAPTPPALTRTLKKSRSKAAVEPPSPTFTDQPGYLKASVPPCLSVPPLAHQGLSHLTECDKGAPVVPPSSLFGSVSMPIEEVSCGSSNMPH